MRPILLKHVCMALLVSWCAASALAQALPRRALAAEPDYDFWFTRLMYDSGNWDVDQRMPANLIMALVEYTNLRVDPKEHVLALDEWLAPYRRMWTRHLDALERRLDDLEER